MNFRVFPYGFRKNTVVSELSKAGRRTDRDNETGAAFWGKAVCGRCGQCGRDTWLLHAYAAEGAEKKGLSDR